MKGCVRFFNDEKGWGFIGSENGPDVFCHYSVIQMPGRKTLREGDKVEFEVETAEKGPRAKNVTLIGASPVSKSTQEVAHE